MSIDGSPGAELRGHIDPAGCGHLLSASRFGRLAVVDGGRPVMVVLNHHWSGGDLLFRTGAESVLARLTGDGAGAEAVFEVDDAFPMGREGWSVMARGTLTRETDPATRERVEAAITPWAGGERHVILRLAVQELTGRRVGGTAG